MGDNPLYFFLERYNDAFIREVEEFLDAIMNNQGMRDQPSRMELWRKESTMAAKESLISGRPAKVKPLE